MTGIGHERRHGNNWAFRLSPSKKLAGKKSIQQASGASDRVGKCERAPRRSPSPCAGRPGVPGDDLHRRDPPARKNPAVLAGHVPVLGVVTIVLLPTRGEGLVAVGLGHTAGHADHPARLAEGRIGP